MKYSGLNFFDPHLELISTAKQFSACRVDKYFTHDSRQSGSSIDLDYVLYRNPSTNTTDSSENM